jgi:phosphoglycolate phosphatase
MEAWRVRAVVFDLDGTLVDSAADLLKALNTVLAERGLPQISLEEIKGMIGDGARKLVERALAATGADVVEDTPQALERFLAVYTGSATENTRMYPGVAETLDALGRAGMRMALVTNKPYAATTAILAALGIERHFAAVVGGDTLPERKPHPAPIQRALAEIGVAAAEAVMVGDNYHDIEAGHAAGTRAVAVTYGYSHRPPAELGADHVIDAMPDLLSLMHLL